MKYLLLLTCLLISGALKAQQAKAYELVHYSAKIDSKTILLEYADGYLAASQIRIKQSKQATQLFQPGSGTTADNGDFVFTHQEAQIVLHHIDENDTAPRAIKASYVVKGRKLSLYFKKIKR